MKPLPKPLPCPVCRKEPTFSPSTIAGRIDLECYGWVPWYGYHKITLEDGAQYIAQEGKSVTGYEARLAALIRAAQEVVDAAEQIDGGLITFEGCLMLAVTPELVDDLKEALTAFRKLEEGE